MHSSHILQISAGVALVIFLFSSASTWLINVDREQGKDAAVRGNLETIKTQTLIAVFSGDWQKEAAAGDCRSGMFTEPTIASALSAVAQANNNGRISCGASDGSFIVIAERPRLGFFKPESDYWCSDAVHDVCPVSTDAHDAGNTCPCNNAP
jgi:hypothetical protein